jgi:hypothetical protein
MYRFQMKGQLDHLNATDIVSAQHAFDEYLAYRTRCELAYSRMSSEYVDRRAVHAIRAGNEGMLAIRDPRFTEDV